MAATIFPVSEYAQASIGYYSAPGTVYTRKTDQQFGDLRIDDGGRGSVEETTTIAAVGQHTIVDIAPLAGMADHYRVTVAADSGADWPEPGARPDQSGLRGLWVSLDGNPDSTLYEIIDNTSHSILVKSAADLDGYVGKTLMGVIRLDSLTMSEHGNLVTDDVLYADTYFVPNIGKIAGVPHILLQDKVVAGHLEIGSQVYRSLQAGSLTVADGRAFILNNLEVKNGDLHITGTGNLRVDGTITVQGNLIVDGTRQLSADAVHIQGDLILTAGNLELDIEGKVTVAGNVTLNSGTVLTVPDADEATNTIYPLALNIAGALTIDDSSAIDLTGKGYPAGKTIGFGNARNDVGGSYGGIGGGGSFDDTYGDFREAIFAGGGGDGAAGGGLLTLSAKSVVLQGNGAILANGESKPYLSGAGGGIHIEAETLMGTGRIQARGGESSAISPSGSGGRISIGYLNMLLGEDNISARGGEGTDVAGHPERVGGAGTIYLKKPDDAGRLLVDNHTAGRTSQWCPLRSVGLNQIVAWQILPGDRLHVEVAGTPWRTPGESLDGRGLIGLQVALRSDTFDGPDYRIVDNGSNWLTLDTSDLPAGQSIEAGDALIGVIHLQSLKIANGARLKTTDRLVVADEQGIEGTEGSGLYFGQWENWYNSPWPIGLELMFAGDQILPSMDLSGGNIAFGGTLAVTGTMSLTGSQVQIQGELIADEGAILTDSQTTIEGNITIDGNLSLAGGNLTAHGGIDLQSIGVLALTGSQAVVQGNITVNGGVRLTDSQLEANGAIVAQGIDGLALAGSHAAVHGNINIDAGLAMTDSQLDADAAVAVKGVAGMTLSGSQAYVKGAVVVEAGVTLTESQLDADGVVTVKGGAGMSLTGGKLIVKNGIEVTRDVTLQNSGGVVSTITVPDAVASSKSIYPLAMNVGGTLTIGGDSSIDLTGKGYPADRTVGFRDTANSDGGSYGAMGGGHSTDLTFGDFRHANFAGSGGYNSAGGGLLNLKAGNISLVENGTIFANGKIASIYSGAGGGIHIETGSLTGTGFIQALGGVTTSTSSNTYSGSGGRISIYSTSMLLAENHLMARGGERSTASPNLERVGGAGTIYLKKAADAGRLLVDNQTAGRTSMWTPLRSVGQHPVESTDALAADRLRINVAGSPWQAPADSLDGQGLIGLQVDPSANDFAGPFYEIVDNGTNWITIQGESVDQLDLSGAALIGVVVLDSLEIRNGAVFTTTDRLVLSNTLDLDPYTNIRFGQLEGWEDINFPANTTLQILGDTVAQSLTLSNVQLTINGDLRVKESLAMEGMAGSTPSLKADSIWVGGNMMLENAQLICPDVEAGGDPASGAGDIYLLGGAVWSVSDATATLVYPLSITTPGKLNVGDNAVINLNGKGYLNNYVGPDGSYQNNDFSLLATHGGLSSYAAYDGSYGRYQRARYPGSGGRDGRGGGFAGIKAGSLYLSKNGLITANGIDAYGAGAGGGIHFEISGLFEGDGKVSARGGNSTTSSNDTRYHSGGGGRISMDIAPAGDKFVGFLDVNGGSYGASKVAGAGTVYFGGEEYRAEDLVSLSVNNGGRTASEGSTPIRSVGRFTVANAVSLGGGAWTLFTDTTHWNPSSPAYGWGIVGSFIDLDPATTEGPYFRIIDNGSDNFTIDDPGGYIGSVDDVIGRDFIGVHRFSTVHVTGGAAVSFGADRVIVTDTDNSVWDSSSQISADSLSVLPVQEGQPQ